MDDLFGQYRESLERGHQAVLAGRPRDALAHYEEATRLAPARALPHVCIGGVLVRTGRVGDAIAAYDRALERAPDDAAALSGKVIALRAGGRHDEAESLSARLAELESEGAQRRRAAADAALAEEAGRSGTLSRAEVLYVAGEAAWSSGREEAAIDAWLESAAAHATAGHLDAALDSCQRALLAAPASPRVHLELARLYLRRGWTDRAGERLELLDRLLDLEPDAGLRAAIHELAREHAADDPRLAVLAARR